MIAIVVALIITIAGTGYAVWHHLDKAAREERYRMCFNDNTGTYKQALGYVPVEAMIEIAAYCHDEAGL